jgi:hypothetical protein
MIVGKFSGAALGRLMRNRFSCGFGCKLLVFDDPMEYASPPDHFVAAPGFRFEDQAPAVDFHKSRDGIHSGSERHGFYMVHFNAHAHCDRPWRQAGRTASELANSIIPLIAGVEKTAGQAGSK